MHLSKKKQYLLLNTSTKDLEKVFPKYTQEELLAYKAELQDASKIISDFRDKDYQKQLEKRVKSLEKELVERDRALNNALNLSKVKPKGKIRATKNGSKISAIACIVASDWHIDQIVKSKTISGLNEFNQKIANDRIDHFFNNAIRLYKINSADTRMDGTVLALLGDFITGVVKHGETLGLEPMPAIIWVYEKLVAGIDLMAKEIPNLTIVCAGGNHGRISDRILHSMESEWNLEYMMYIFLKNRFPKLNFIVGEGYHIYLDVYDRSIRFHHGHAIRYGGGIGGIFIPVYKAISQWNKAKRADLDVFGHFHQLKNGGNFITNGSLVGFNAFALKIKADFEIPAQKFFLYSSEGIVMGEYPILLK